MTCPTCGHSTDLRECPVDGTFLGDVLKELAEVSPEPAEPTPAPKKTRRKS